MKIKNLQDVMVRMYYGQPNNKHPAIVGPKQTTTELPSERVFDNRLLKDLEDGKIELILSDFEKTTLQKIINCCGFCNSSGSECCKGKKVDTQNVVVAKKEKPLVDTKEPALESKKKAFYHEGDGIIRSVKKENKEVKPAKERTREDAVPIRVHSFAQSLGISARALISVMHNLGLNPKSHMASVPPEHVEAITNAVKEQNNLSKPKDAPKVERSAPVRSNERRIIDSHSVPPNSNGMPSIPKPSGTNIPSLDDLQFQNAKLSLSKGAADA